MIRSRMAIITAWVRVAAPSFLQQLLMRLHGASRDGQGVGDLVAGSPDGRERQRTSRSREDRASCGASGRPRSFSTRSKA